jgi:hypothetical protein
MIFTCLKSESRLSIKLLVQVLWFLYLWVVIWFDFYTTTFWFTKGYQYAQNGCLD